jgi:hypothetical protein
VQRSNPNAPCNVGGKSTQCFIAYRRLQQITRWGSCGRVNWTCPSLKVWVEKSPTLHVKVTNCTFPSLKYGWQIHPHYTVKVTYYTFPTLKYGWKIHPHCTIKEDQLWCLFVCLFVIPIYPCKVHAMCINELEAFLEFQAKISENNWILGKNVVLWVHFHPASTVKVNDVILLFNVLTSSIDQLVFVQVTNYLCNRLFLWYNVVVWLFLW